MYNRPFNKKVWMSSPTIHEEEVKFVKEAFDSNWVSTVGENIDQFETNICDYLGCKYAVALSSGTAAIHMALKMCGLKKGERVFCSDLTFAATANPIIYEKATPVFIDSEYETWNMDPEALERAFKLFPDTKYVVLVHLYGTPAKLDEIIYICDKYGAILIEDAAESLGAVYKKRQTGTFGKYNAISFNGNKIITTSGGGMFLTDDKDAETNVRKLSTQAREPSTWYQHELIGYNYRMSNILAGIGRGQLFHLDEHIKIKKRIYEKYKAGLKGVPITMNPYNAATMEPNFWLSCILVDKKAMCEQIRGNLKATYIAKENKTCPTEIIETLNNYNIESRPIWKPMHMQPVFKNASFVSIAENVIDRDIFNRGVCLPSDIKMSEKEQDIIIEIIKKCFETE